MNRTAFLTVLAVGLACGYVFFFTDWLEKKKIQIGYRNLPRAAGLPATAANPVQFLLAREVSVSRIRVYPAPGDVFQKAPPHYVWELVAVTNGAPVTDFVYGQPIPGMKNFGPQEPLQPNTSYAISVESGKLKGEKIFKTLGPTPPPN